ncbi:MAG: hypothetical protein WCO56_03470 [Verrucomicrobiota bacterium]
MKCFIPFRSVYWLTLSLGAGTLLAAERFPFVIPGDDASPTITDLAGLSPKPAGADGFVRIRDGHFYTDSSRLKLWGVNTCFSANFPTHEEAEKVAAHFAKLGINAVRMHHHDTANSPRGVWGPIVNGQRTLDPQQLDRQDYFLDQLNQHGVYANLNLHVGRAFTEAEGFTGKDLPYAVHYDKYLLYFEPRMRARFKEFCRDYLTHVNPYRKLKRSEDPGVAVVEIVNENSFSRDGARTAASLPEPYRGEFKKQWNEWLSKHYADTAALTKAWGSESEPLGPMVADSSAWKTNLGAWRAHQTQGFPFETRFNQAGPEPKTPAMQVRIVKKALEVMQQELILSNLTLETNQLYTVSFWIKSDTRCAVHADISNQGPGNWSSVGFREQVQAVAKWQQVHRVFRTTADIPGKVRFCLKFGGQEGNFYIGGVRLRKGGEYIVIPMGQSLEEDTIEIPVDGWSEVAVRDVKHFMEDTEIGFIRELTEYLKKDLGVRVPITASQITYHGADIVAQTCDYTDIHAYWQHPRFPGRPWDPQNWTISNTPMETVPNSDRLLACAPWRLLDRPFTISEWNIPDPNDYAASVVPFAAMVAALQDWDGVFFFQYSNGGGEWFGDRMNGYFSFGGQPVKLAMLTACANMYRRGDLAPLPQVAAGSLKTMMPATLALSHRLGMDPKAEKAAELPAVANPKLLTGPGVLWDATDTNRAVVQVNTPATRAIWGLVAEGSYNLGGVQLKFGPIERNYAALVLTSQDGQPLEKSKRILLTVVGSAQNQGMIWNEQRTSVNKNWGTGPTMVNGIPVELTLPFRVQSVHALNPKGERQGTVPVQADGAQSRLAIGPEFKTLWYELTAE